MRTALKRFFDPGIGRRCCRAIAGEMSILSLSRGKADGKKWLTRRRVTVICERERALLFQVAWKPRMSTAQRIQAFPNCFANFIVLSKTGHELPLFDFVISATMRYYETSHVKISGPFAKEIASVSVSANRFLGKNGKNKWGTVERRKRSVT